MALDLDLPLLDNAPPVPSPTTPPGPDPLLTLLHKFWRLRSADRVSVARAIGTSAHLGKTCGRIDDLLRGRAFRQYWFDQLVDHLAIPAEAVAQAQQDHKDWVLQSCRWEECNRRQKQFRRRGPYAQVLLPDRFVPFSSLVSRLARDYRNYLPIPSELLSQAAPNIAAAPQSSDSGNRPNLTAIIDWLKAVPAKAYQPSICAGFLIHLNLDDIYIFNNQGQLLQSGPSEIALPEGFKELRLGE